MSTAGLFVLLALTVGVLTFIAWPLIAGTNSADSAEPTTPNAAIDSMAALQRDYDATLNTLRDLDFDFQTGKLAAADYPPQREMLVAQGADLLWRIDALKTQLVESAVESAISAQRAPHPRQASQSPRARIEAALAAQGKPAKTPSKAKSGR
ncbi:MAG: hypothetical protein ACYDBJ_13410 [Aggregatilineales bacterium]